MCGFVECGVGFFPSLKIPQAINKIPSGVEIDDTVHIGKSAVAFSLTDERLSSKKPFFCLKFIILFRSDMT